MNLCPILTFTPAWCEVNPAPVRGNNFMDVAGKYEALPVEASVENRKRHFRYPNICFYMINVDYNCVQYI